MNERLIYEWLRPELKGASWHKGSARLGPMAYMGSDTSQWFYIPKLDMNTWHGEVVPKLLSEGVNFVYFGAHGSGGDWEIMLHAPFASHSRLNYIAVLPYDALTEYLEAK